MAAEVGIRVYPTSQLNATILVVTPVVIIAELLTNPFVGAFKDGQGSGEHVREPVQFPARHTPVVCFRKPAMQTGVQIVPLGLFMHSPKFSSADSPNAPLIRTLGGSLQGFGEHIEAPVQTPAVQLKDELAV